MIPAGFDFNIGDGRFLGAEINKPGQKLAADSLRAGFFGDYQFPNGSPGLINAAINKTNRLMAVTQVGQRNGVEVVKVRIKVLVIKFPINFGTGFEVAGIQL